MQSLTFENIQNIQLKQKSKIQIRIILKVFLYKNLHFTFYKKVSYPSSVIMIEDD